jgi:2,3-bisphosphoglycerate-independent phosphoglycerate mutase
VVPVNTDIVMAFLDGDTLIFIDFRADRMRQIVEAFGIKPQFETDKIPKAIVSDK